MIGYEGGLGICAVGDEEVAAFMHLSLRRSQSFLRRFYAGRHEFDFDDCVFKYLAELLAKFVSARQELVNKELVTLYLSDMLQQHEEVSEDLFSRGRAVDFLKRRASGDYATFYYGFFGKPNLPEIARRAAIHGKQFIRGRGAMKPDDFVRNAQRFYSDAADIGQEVPEFVGTARVLGELASSLPQCVELMRAMRCEFFY